MLRRFRSLFRLPARRPLAPGRKTRRTRIPQAWPSGIERLEDRTLLSVIFIFDPPPNSLPAPETKTAPVDDAVSGRVYNDINGNGRYDAGEPPLAGVMVYADFGPFTLDRFRVSSVKDAMKSASYTRTSRLLMFGNPTDGKEQRPSILQLSDID